ncbi:hypothetical protein B566_EDAN012399 [Ephemera danica]|nr:hypothetical protein B566_EDAN012399 [Ephemera danica]
MLYLVYWRGELVLQAEGPASIPPSLSFLRVARCDRVIVKTRAFATLRSLRRVELVNIGQLDVQEAGLVWEPHRHSNHTAQNIGGGPPNQYEEVYGGPNTLTSVTMILDSISKCPQLSRFTFGGHLDLISITNTNIDKIDSYAFTNLRGKIDKIEFRNTNINHIDALAFRRIYIETMSFVHCNIKKIQSRSMYETRIKRDFIFDDVTVGEIASLGVALTGPMKTIIKSCQFEHISGEAFRIATRGIVVINGNIFEIMDSGALAGIKPMSPEEIVQESFLYNPEEHDSPHTVPSIEDGGKPPRPKRPDFKFVSELLLQNNTLKQFSDGALYINKGYDVTYSKLVLSHTMCECTGSVTLITNLVGIPQSPYDEFASTPHHDTSQLYRTTWCLTKSKYKTLPEFREEHCSTINKGSVVYVSIGVAVLVLIVIVLAALVFIYWWRRKKGLEQKLTIVVPEARTYRETELQVIVEHAEPIPAQPETHRLVNAKYEQQLQNT